MFNIIVAVSKNFIIGSNNNIPWDCKEDMKYFRKITSTSNNNKENVIIMGYNTWKSIGRKLPRRINIVIDRNAILPKVENNVIFVNSLDVALNHIEGSERGEIFVIGGGKVYREALVRKDLDKVYLTKINKKFEGDITFPKLKDNFKLIKVKRGGDDDMKLEFRIYQRTDEKHEEYQYLERIEEIMRDGEVCSDRTGVGPNATYCVSISVKSNLLYVCL